MTYFDELLEKGDRRSKMLPLWKLKITEEEYLGLINCLRQRVINSSLGYNNPFMANTKECALFYAEYWRREYSGEGHSKKEAFKKLGLQERFDCFCNDFHEAAIEGAKQLHIEIYDEKRNEWLDSMFYQGGLPMKLVTEGRVTSVWNRFARGLVCRRKNFDELGLGVIGENSSSLNEFCDCIIDALDAEDIEKMPFKCDDDTYKYLQELKTRERHHQKMAHPFSLDWELRIDAVEKKIYTSYVVTGPHRLPQDFFEVNKDNIANPNFFSILVKKGKDVIPFDYANNFCRYNVEYKDAYHPGEVISVSIDDKTPIISDDLDMDTPHLMYMNNEGKYELGNRIGRQESFLLIPEGWNAEDMHGLCMERYEYEGAQYGGIMIPDDFKEEITIRNGGDMLTFGCNIPLYWTELNSLPEDTPNITESLYDASKARFVLCNDTEDGVRKHTNAHIEYRSKWDKEWKAEPGYGEIFARAKDNNGHFVTPVKFINIGKGVKVKVVEAKEDSCKIKVTWDHGRVIAADNIRQMNGEWVVNKEDITNNDIRFTLVPEDNSNNQFLIHVKAPFKKFAILDANYNAINSESWIPYSEIDRFKYHLIGQNIRYTYGEHQRELKWIGGELCIKENQGSIKRTIKRSIPYEGSLVSLFESREELRFLMGHTSRDIIGAEVKVTLRTQDGQQLTFAIKDSPYRVEQNEDGSMYIKDTKEIDFKGSLKLFKLDDPKAETTVTLEYDQENGYRLPETIASWGKTLVTGCARGTILPALMDTTHILTKDERTAIKEETIRQISQELKGAHLGDKLWQWIMGRFNMTHKEAIPASSLLELRCVGKSPKALICLAFLLYGMTAKESRYTLTEQMKSLGADLAFSWYWLMPHLESTLITIRDFINDNFNDPYISLICINWAMTQCDAMADLNILSNPSNAERVEKIGKCLIDTIGSFDKWIKELCVDSLVETYACRTDKVAASTARDIVYNRDNLIHIDIDMDRLGYVDVSQDFINKETAGFFEAYTKSNSSVNENWLMERVKAVEAHLNGKVDLFAQSDEIRRSIIFCSKSCNRQFIINLNNKLA